MSGDTARKRDSHPIRLALVMLLGAGLGFTFFTGPGNMNDLEHAVQPYTNAIIGALIGLTVDYCFRPWHTRSPRAESPNPSLERRHE